MDRQYEPLDWLASAPLPAKLFSFPTEDQIHHTAKSALIHLPPVPFSTMKLRQDFRRLLVGGCVPILLLIATGCTTINPTSATAFSTGITAARAQTKTAFDTVVSLSRSSSVDYASNQPSLNEEMLVSVPNAAAVAAWDEVLDPVEHYAQHLSSLASGGASTGTEDAMGSLAKQFNTTSSDLKSNTGVGNATQITTGPASALAAVAGALERARAVKQASEVAKATDNEIRGIFTALADAIGLSASSGLRGTVRANWNQQLIMITQDFLNAGSPEKRKPIVEKYVDLLNRRDAQDEQLAALRRTYLALADAHSALAKGNETDLRGAITFITSELKHARDLQAQFAKTLAN
jgi:hypothetical protein